MGCDCTKLTTPIRVAPITESTNHSVLQSIDHVVQDQKRMLCDDTHIDVKSVPTNGLIDQSASVSLRNFKPVTTDEPAKHENDNSSSHLHSNLEPRANHLSQKSSDIGASNKRTLSSNKNNNHRVMFDDDIISISDALPVTPNDDHVEILDAAPDAFNPLFLKQRQDAIDNLSYRSTIESWKPESLADLVKTIKIFSRKKPLVDLHWMIFYWIAHNIEYDAEAYFNNNFPVQSAEEIFHTKKGLCGGYSHLYKHVCDKLHVKCFVVNGYAKGYGYEKHDTNVSPGVYHAWNVVKIKKYWYLVDLTWGAGHINVQDRFIRKLNPYHFLVRPYQMIRDHLPEEYQWQLLQTPIQVTQYLQMPITRALYFDLNLQLLSPLYQTHLSFVNGRSYASVVLRAPADVELSASLKLNGNTIDGGDRIIFNDKKQLYRCYFAPSTIGKHIVSICAKRINSESKIDNEVLEFKLDVDELPQNPISYPRTWKEFYKLGLKVISPKNTHLIKVSNGNTHACVFIYAPHDIELIGALHNSDNKKIQGGEQVYYDREKRLWTCRYAPDQDGLFKANIYAKKKSEIGIYPAVISFKIEATDIAVSPLSYPYMWQIAHDLSLEIEAPKNCSSIPWPEDASYVEILVRAPDHVRVLCSIHYDHVEIQNGSLYQFNHEKNVWQLFFAPEHVGQHILFVFAKQDNEESSHCAMKFYLDVTQLHRPMKFPTIYEQFLRFKGCIYEPLNGVLERDSTVFTHCIIPGMDDVNLTIDGNWCTADGYHESILKRQVTIGSNDLTIHGRYEGKSSYISLIKYSIR